MQLNFRMIFVGAMVLFVAGVVLLSTFGKGLIHEMEVSDATVDYLDLGRQASTKRDYLKAEEMYKQAMTAAQASGPDHPTVAYAMVAYAEFLRKRKRFDEAKLLEAQARTIQQNEPKQQKVH
jgi:hypothetical protein